MQPDLADILMDETTAKENKALYEMEFNYSDYLGDLTLRQIQLYKDKTNRFFPVFPDGNFRMTWDSIGLCFIVY